MSERLTLQEALSLTEKLQKAEAGKLAAEMALKTFSDMYNDENTPYIEALSRSSEILASIDLTAAREVMDKAREADTLRTELAAAQVRIRQLEELAYGGGK